MPTANEVLQDATLRHAIDVQRFSRGETKRVLSLLEAADKELVATLRTRLATLPVPVDFRSSRLLAILADMRRARGVIMARLEGELSRGLPAFADVEATAEKGLLEFAVPIEYQFAGVSLEQLRTAVTTQPFHGKNLGAWWQRLATADQDRVQDAIQLGYSQGESVPAIVRRVAGTRARRYTDGALSISRRNAEAVVRTAINHTSNVARSAIWEANSDVIAGLMWTSTLDGRTTLICMSRDGKVAPVGDKPLPPEAIPLSPPGARPPAHPNCRSIMTAYFDGAGLIGDRPFVRTTKRRGAREVDFRTMAKEQGRSVSAVRRDWTAKNVGTLPAKTTYEKFLRRQPAAFQDDVLGGKKGALFRRGGLKIENFVSRTGDVYTLEQLAARHPGAFAQANIGLS